MSSVVNKHKADGSLKAVSPNNRKPSKTAPPGRKCGFCDRPLSIYNRGSVCGPCQKAVNE